jgi:hypothetical protein
MNLVPQVAFMKYRNINNNCPPDAQEFLGLNRLRKRDLFLFEPATFRQIGFDRLVFSFYPHGKNIPEKLRTRNLQLSTGFSIYP